MEIQSRMTHKITSRMTDRVKNPKNVVDFEDFRPRKPAQIHIDLYVPYLTCLSLFILE